MVEGKKIIERAIHVFSNKFEITPIYFEEQYFCGVGMENGTLYMVRFFAPLSEFSSFANQHIPDLRKVNKPTDTHLSCEEYEGDCK
jgi:hypothetical protein